MTSMPALKSRLTRSRPPRRRSIRFQHRRRRRSHQCNARARLRLRKKWLRFHRQVRKRRSRLLSSLLCRSRQRILPRQSGPRRRLLRFIRLGFSLHHLHHRLRNVSLLEETLGTNWLNKLGIIMVVLGIALFGIYELGELGPLGKVILSCMVSGVLLGGGIYLEKKEHYQILGRTGIGGGWALLFFIAYAVNHVHAMQVLNSATADSILMLAVASAMTGHTLRY